LEYVRQTREQGALERVILVHGEPPAQDTLRRALEAQEVARVHVPEREEVLRI
jgi:hypothetical protein